MLGGLLSFFATPFGRVALIGVALLGWTLYQRDLAADKAREECQAEQLQKTVEELIRQRNAAQEAAKRAAEQAAATREELMELQSEFEAIQLTQEEGDASCHIPESVLNRLRNIR